MTDGVPVLLILIDIVPPSTLISVVFMDLLLRKAQSLLWKKQKPELFPPWSGVLSFCSPTTGCDLRFSWSLVLLV